MEHPEADDGIALLRETAPVEVPAARPLRQVLLIVAGWAIVLALVCVVVAVLSPGIPAFVAGVVKALTPSGMP